MSADDTRGNKVTAQYIRAYPVGWFIFMYCLMFTVHSAVVAVTGWRLPDEDYAWLTHCLPLAVLLWLAGWLWAKRVAD